MDWTLLLQGWLLAAGLMLVLWLAQLRTRDAGIVDVGWTLAVGLLATYYAANTAGPAARRFLVQGLASLWSLRLAAHIFMRHLGKPEDSRYANLRQGWGPRAQPYFFLVFQANALAAAAFSVPFLAVLGGSRPLGGWDALGVGIWLAAVGGEAAADRQLRRFKSWTWNRGQTCREGLWRYSRHPNYFFEWLHWWAYVPMAWGAPSAGLALLGPALMLFLLFKVTGIPAAEAQALKSRGEDYREYQRETSIFIPWFPRRGV